MTETAQPKRGGKAFHSILEPHFDFIREQRQRRKTWQEIAKSLLIEKGIRVTLYAPYRFYRRKLKRAAKPNWENVGNDSDSHPPALTWRPAGRNHAHRRCHRNPFSNDPTYQPINTEKFT